MGILHFLWEPSLNLFHGLRTFGRAYKTVPLWVSCPGLISGRHVTRARKGLSSGFGSNHPKVHLESFMRRLLARPVQPALLIQLLWEPQNGPVSCSSSETGRRSQREKAKGSVRTTWTLVRKQTLILSQGNHQCAHLGLTSSSNGHT